MRISLLCLFIGIGLLVSSCQEVIDVNLKNAPSLLVIEANITNDSDIQTVIVSRTKPFSATNSMVPVTNAEVSIKDSEGKIHEFTKGIEGSYSTGKLRGIPGKTYYLKVNIEGKEYAASSTMPNQVFIDSLRLGVSTFAGDKNKFVEVAYKDPGETENYYRFKLFVNGKASKKIFAYSDYFTDGRYVFRDLNDFDLNINSGDNVEIQMECIDKNVYRYWSGLDQNLNRGGASTTPANPVSNISNGALGYFSAHTIERRLIKIP